MRRVWQNRRDATDHCKGCPGCDSPYPLGGLGSEDADVMLIAQEPAYNVDNDTVDIDMDWTEAHRELVNNRRESMNPLWQHLMNVSLAAKCSPEELYFTNISKCSTDDSSFSDRVKHCRGYLPREVAQVDPDIMLLYGSKVINIVFDIFDIDWSKKVGDVHAEVFETSSLKLIPLYHWGYIYRQGDLTSYHEEVQNVIKSQM